MAMTLSSVMLTAVLCGCQAEESASLPVSKVEASDTPQTLVGDDAGSDKYAEVTLGTADTEPSTSGDMYEVTGQAMTALFVWGLSDNVTAMFDTDLMDIKVEQGDTETAYIWAEEYAIMEYRQAVNRGYIDLIVHIPCKDTDYTAEDAISEIKTQVLHAGVIATQNSTSDGENASAGTDITLLYDGAEKKYKMPEETMRFMISNMAKYVQNPVTEAAFDITFGVLNDGSAYLRMIRSTTGVAIPSPLTKCPDMELREPGTSTDVDFGANADDGAVNASDTGEVNTPAETTATME